MEDVFQYLEFLNIDYSVYKHPAVFTVKEAEKSEIDDDFGENKNLFLRNNKGSRHYLVTLEASKELDIKKLAEKLEIGRLGFAGEDRLEKYLGLKPGVVSPFGLINDVKSEVVYILDSDLLKEEKVGFHPNINTQTVILKTEDFKKYLDSLKNEVKILDLQSGI